MAGRVTTLALALVVTAWAGGALAADDAVARCDALAANPYDPDTPQGKGVGFNRIDGPAAVEACTAALAAEPGNVRMQYQLGRALDAAGDAPRAVENLEAAAAAGYTSALNSLGALYEGGYGVPADPEKAIGYYRQAAEAGLPIAMANLGSLYERGVGVAQDYEQAAKYYRQAADLGLGYGAASLGFLYERGYGMPADEVEALRLYKIGADANEDFALRNVGLMYLDGRGGVEADAKQAMDYFRRALDAGMTMAQLDIARLLRDGAPGVEVDKAESERLLRELFDNSDAQLAADAKNDLAWSYALANERLDEAETLSRAAVAADGKANFLDTLGWILHLQGRDDEARPVLERAVALEPDTAEFTEHLEALSK